MIKLYKKTRPVKLNRHSPYIEFNLLATLEVKKVPAGLYQLLKSVILKEKGVPNYERSNGQIISLCRRLFRKGNLERYSGAEILFAGIRYCDWVHSKKRIPQAGDSDITSGIFCYVYSADGQISSVPSGTLFRYGRLKNKKR